MCWSSGSSRIAVFETILGMLRTYLFAHTTNRIDVELGARLFRHLLALPIAYFQARRVGDSVARVRELENIRNFLTSSALTLVIDLFFTFVFLGGDVRLLAAADRASCLAAFPFYIGISAGATPLFRRRLDEKFRRGAENQAFLVESVTGVETLKAMAVEPQMQRRWEEQLAGYVAASFRVLRLGNTASNSRAARQQARHGRHSLFRRQARHRRRPDRRRARRLQHAGRPRQRAGAAARPDLAGFPPGAAVGRAARRHSQHAAGADVQSGPRRAAGDPRRHHLRARHLPLSHRRAGGPARRQFQRIAPARSSASSAPPARARARSPS